MRIEPEVIIRTLLKNNGQVRVTARELAISPSTVLNWRRRARTNSRGTRYLATTAKRHSTKPKTVRTTSLSAEQQDAVLKLRRERGIGAIKIAASLQMPRKYKTIHRFLKKKGLTAPTKNYRRPRYQETTHMQVKNTHAPGKLQMDVKYVTPELSGLVHTAYLYAIMDIYSRYKAGVILPAVDQALAIEALKYMAPTLPFSVDFVQTDNGLEFQSRFKEFVTKELHWEHHHIHKSSPNENAVIERSFRTDEEEFFWRLEDRAQSIDDLNEQYQDYLYYYNNERVHLGIDLLTPVQKLYS